MKRAALTEDLGLVADDAHRLAIEAGEADDDVLGVAGEQLEEPALVDHLADYLAHVVGHVGVRWYRLGEAFALPVPLVAAGHLDGFCQRVVRQVGEDLRCDVDGIALVLGHQARNPAATGVLLGSPEARLIHLSLDYLRYHVGTAHEHLAVLRA